jgi:hypothetical protein
LFHQNTNGVAGAEGELLEEDELRELLRRLLRGAAADEIKQVKGSGEGKEAVVGCWCVMM